MLVPKLEPVSRNREYNSYTDEQKDSIIYNYLFAKARRIMLLLKKTTF